MGRMEEPYERSIDHCRRQRAANAAGHSQTVSAHTRQTGHYLYIGRLSA